MSATDSKLKMAADPEARKRLLLLACTIDRLELASACDRSVHHGPVLRALTQGPWIDLAATALLPLLPRRLRMISAAWRLWQRSGRRN